MNDSPSPRRYFGHITLAIFAAATASACKPCPLGEQVTVIAGDTTGPSVGMTATFQDPSRPDEQRPNASVSGSGTDVTVTARDNEIVSLVASGSDNQGAKEIRIWVESTGWRTSQQVGPGLLGSPSAVTAITASPGDKVCTPLRVTHEVRVDDFKRDGNGPFTSIRLRVTAEAVNFSGQSAWSKGIVVNWP